jgi:hypothetical protein
MNDPVDNTFFLNNDYTVNLKDHSEYSKGQKQRQRARLKIDGNNSLYNDDLEDELSDSLHLTRKRLKKYDYLQPIVKGNGSRDGKSIQDVIIQFSGVENFQTTDSHMGNEITDTIGQEHISNRAKAA